MQILRPKRSRFGFRAVELDHVLPEVVEVAEYWRGSNFRVDVDALQFWTLLCLPEGTLRIGSPGSPEIFFKRGSIGWVPPGVRHWRQYGPEATHHVMLVSLHLKPIGFRHPEWNLSESLNRPRSIHGASHLEQYFIKVLHEATTADKYQVFGLQLAVDTLVLEILRKITVAKQTLLLALPAVHPAVSKALELLETRFREHWTLSKLAREVGLSRSRLAELFNGEAGYSIHKFLTKVRVRHGEMLLTHSDLPVGHIASECGFGSIQHFSRVFREMNGQAPFRFRRPVKS
jgi:AraC-like DNA-binding protein